MKNQIILLHEQFCQEALLIKNFRPTTIRWYKKAILQFLGFYDNRLVSLGEITTERLRQYLCNKRANGNWKADTFLNQYKAIKSFLKWAVKNGYLNSNPIESIEKPRLEKKLPKRITKQDAETVLEYAFYGDTSYRFERYRNRALLAIMIFAGLRANEVLTLRLNHVDMLNRIINVHQGKGAKDRIVPMSGKLFVYLKEYIEDRKRLNKKSEYLFVSIRGDKPFTYSGLKRIVNKIRNGTGINFTPHRLRHTFATLMLEGGCDLFSLKEMMGHSDIKTTTIYLSATVNMLQEQIRKHPLDGIVSK